MGSLIRKIFKWKDGGYFMIIWYLCHIMSSWGPYSGLTYQFSNYIPCAGLTQNIIKQLAETDINWRFQWMMNSRHICLLHNSIIKSFHPCKIEDSCPQWSLQGLHMNILAARSCNVKGLLRNPLSIWSIWCLGHLRRPTKQWSRDWNLSWRYGLTLATPFDAQSPIDPNPQLEN